ncbi:hypothetical protein P7C70_g8734, partial [Phenoliferia sp. Uapishka_3]
MIDSLGGSGGSEGREAEENTDGSADGETLLEREGSKKARMEREIGRATTLNRLARPISTLSLWGKPSVFMRLNENHALPTSPGPLPSTSAAPPVAVRSRSSSLPPTFNPSRTALCTSPSTLWSSLTSGARASQTASTHNATLTTASISSSTSSPLSASSANSSTNTFTSSSSAPSSSSASASASASAALRPTPSRLLPAYKDLYDLDIAEGKTGLAKVRTDFYELAQEVHYFEAGDSDVVLARKRVELRDLCKRVLWTQKFFDDWKPVAGILSGVAGGLVKILLRLAIPPQQQKDDAWIGDFVTILNSGLASLLPGLGGELLGLIVSSISKIYESKLGVEKHGAGSVRLYHSQKEKEMALWSLAISPFFSREALEFFSKSSMTSMVFVPAVAPEVLAVIIPEVLATVSQLQSKEMEEVVEAFRRLTELVGANSGGWPTEAKEALFNLQNQ